MQLFDFPLRGKGRRTHFDPEPLRIRVIVIDAFDIDVARREKTCCQLDVNRLGLNRMPWPCMVRQQNCDGVATAHHPGIHRFMHSVYGQYIDAEAVQQLEGAVRRLQRPPAE